MTKAHIIQINGQVLLFLSKYNSVNKNTILPSCCNFLILRNKGFEECTGKNYAQTKDVAASRSSSTNEYLLYHESTTWSSMHANYRLKEVDRRPMCGSRTTRCYLEFSIQDRPPHASCCPGFPRYIKGGDNDG